MHIPSPEQLHELVLAQIRPGEKSSGQAWCRVLSKLLHEMAGGNHCNLNLTLDLAPLKQELRALESRIMSQISDYVTRVESKFAEIKNGIQSLRDQITNLNNSPGKVTPEDQVLLDKLESDASDLAGNLAPPTAPATVSGSSTANVPLTASPTATASAGLPPATVTNNTGGGTSAGPAPEPVVP